MYRLTTVLMMSLTRQLWQARPESLIFQI
uniref:Uncharacterized protein n=1 Tax=Anguilla anguilla TaxID=7936 RepID=A0A0E9TE51_ANGAN